jgi:predicted TIM-barrel fold metal-dependent hydrolase
MRKQFKLTEEQHARLMAACQPVLYIVAGGMEPRSPAENANDTWRELGAELGFVWDTAAPVPGESTHVFTAEVR